MNVLVLNCGSSSLKFQLIATDLDAIENDADRELARGLVERIGSEALLTLRAGDRAAQRLAIPLRDHRQALDHVLRWLVSPKAADTADTAVPGLGSLADVHAVGHRVVHGGEKLTLSVKIDDAVIEQIEDCIDLGWRSLGWGEDQVKRHGSDRRAQLWLRHARSAPCEAGPLPRRFRQRRFRRFQQGCLAGRFVRPDVPNDRLKIVLKPLHILFALLVKPFYNWISNHFQLLIALRVCRS